MDDKRRMLLHFLAGLAYRTQKAVRDAPNDFGTLEVPSEGRPPKELVRHMTSVLGYARTFFTGGQYRATPLESLDAEVVRFHAMIADLGHHLESGTDLRDNMSAERLLQGPFSDAMTHAGQLALLRRLAGSPIRPENFIFADIDPGRLEPDQATPVSPERSGPTRRQHRVHRRNPDGVISRRSAG